MNRTQIIAIGAVLLLVAVILVLALGSRQPPVMPADEDHAAFLDAEVCMACHDRESLQEVNHTPRLDCVACHGWADR